MRMFVRVCMHAHSHVCMHAHSHSHTCILQTHVYMRVHRYVCMYMNTDTHVFFVFNHICVYTSLPMGWLRLVGSLKFYVSFAKESHKRDYILQQRPIILRGLLIVATPYVLIEYTYIWVLWKHLCIIETLYLCPQARCREGERDRERERAEER